MDVGSYGNQRRLARVGILGSMGKSDVTDGDWMHLNFGLGQNKITLAGQCSSRLNFRITHCRPFTHIWASSVLVAAV